MARGAGGAGAGEGPGGGEVRTLPEKGRDTVFPGVPARRSPAEVPQKSRRTPAGVAPKPRRSRAGVPPGSCKGSLLSDGGSLLLE